MTRIAYVNGRYLPQGEASVSMEDRGFQFADGVYEVIAFHHRRFLDEIPHLDRLGRSLEALGIRPPMTMPALRAHLRELVARNGREHGTVYLQVTRGVAKRDHVFKAGMKPTLVMNVAPLKSPKPHEVQNGVGVMTHPDERWARRDIKSVGLLPNALAKQKAASRSLREAWLTEAEGYVTEGAVSNCALVLPSGEIVTHPADQRILGGITRQVALRLAREAGMEVAERPFHRNEIARAAEAFLTSTTASILPVTHCDGQAIGEGAPGPVTRKLLLLYQRHIETQTGYVS
jgi:D-alanine transaminase